MGHKWSPDQEFETTELMVTHAHSSSLSLSRSAAMYDEITQFREACGHAHMKTILAIGELGTFTNVYKSSLVAMMAGQHLGVVAVFFIFFLQLAIYFLQN